MKLLVLDNDIAQCELIKYYAKTFKIECFTTCLLSEFIREFNSAKYDVVSIDYMLDGVNGGIIAKAIRSDLQVPVFILTNYYSKYIEDNHLLTNISKVIQKSEDYKSIFSQMGLL